MKNCLPILLLFAMFTANAQRSLRFFGNGTGDIDRVKIALDNPARPVDVSTDFTIELWIKAQSAGNNGAVTAAVNGDGWITGNIIVDRDVYGNGDFGDYGLSMGSRSGFPPGNRYIAFGVDRLGNGITITGSTHVADNNWHHIAVTRSGTTGVIRLFVDGVEDASGAGPAGDISYRNNRPSSWPNSDPFLVLGAEKHDAGAAYPAYNGLMDELRISSVIRYNTGFARPAAPFITDAQTLGLYHFDEGGGIVLTDVSAATGGPSNGQINYGGSPNGPQWSTDQPFSALSVTLLYARAENAGSNTTLQFATAGEAQTAGYEILYSATGGPFTMLASYRQQEALRARRLPLNQYRFEHAAAGGYFKIRAINTGGHIHWESPVIAVRSAANAVIPLITQQPGYITLVLPGIPPAKTLIRVYDAQAKLLWQQPLRLSATTIPVPAFTGQTVMVNLSQNGLPIYCRLLLVQ